MLMQYSGYVPQTTEDELQRSVGRAFIPSIYPQYFTRNNPQNNDTSIDCGSNSVQRNMADFSLMGEKPNSFAQLDPTQIATHESSRLNNLGRSVQTRSQTRHAHGSSLDRRNFSRSMRNLSGCSRSSYMCRKCKTHGQNIPVKRHKRACPYMNCTCLKCHLVDQGRKVVARQIALYRDQKGGTSRDACEQSPFSKVQQQSSWKDIVSISQASLPNAQGFSSIILRGTNSKRNKNSPGQKQKSPNSIGPHCRRCRNHSLAVTWKGHKKSCPYRNCPCDPCRLINVRKDTEKTLREIAGVSQPFNRPSSSTSKPNMLERDSRSLVPCHSSRSTSKQNSESNDEVCLTTSNNTKFKFAGNNIKSRGADQCQNTNTVRLELLGASDNEQGYSRNAPKHINNPGVGVALKFGPTLPQSVNQSWPNVSLDDIPFACSSLPIRTEPTIDNRSERELSLDWIVNPLTNNTTIETNHFHHHHHHHVHITNPPTLHSSIYPEGRYPYSHLDPISLMGTEHVRQNFAPIDPVQKNEDYFTKRLGNSYDETRSAIKMVNENYANKQDCSSHEIIEAERNLCTSNPRNDDNLIGCNLSLARATNYNSCPGYGFDKSIPSNFYCPERVSAVAAAAAAAAMVAMAPPFNHPSIRRYPEYICHPSCYAPNHDGYSPMHVAQSGEEAYYLKCQLRGKTRNNNSNDFTTPDIDNKDSLSCSTSIQHGVRESQKVYLEQSVPSSHPMKSDSQWSLLLNHQSKESPRKSIGVSEETSYMSGDQQIKHLNTIRYEELQNHDTHHSPAYFTPHPKQEGSTSTTYSSTHSPLGNFEDYVSNPTPGDNQTDRLRIPQQNPKDFTQDGILQPKLSFLTSHGTWNGDSIRLSKIEHDIAELGCNSPNTQSQTLASNLQFPVSNEKHENLATETSGQPANMQRFTNSSEYTVSV